MHEQDSFKNKTNRKYHNADHRSQERPQADVNRPWNGMETETALNHLELQTYLSLQATCKCTNMHYYISAAMFSGPSPAGER